MFWLQDCITSISLVNTYSERKTLNIVDKNLKKFYNFISYFVHLRIFIAILLQETWLGSTERSHHDVAHLQPLTNVPTKYQLPTPYGF